MQTNYISMYRPKNDNSTNPSTLFIGKIEEHLRKANDLAKYLLGSRSVQDFPRSSSPAIFEGLGGGIFNNYSFHCISIDNDSSRHRSLVCSGIAAILAGAAFLGRNFSQLIMAANCKKENQEFKKEYRSILLTNHPHAIKIKELVKNYNDLLNERIKDKIINCALSVAAIVGGIFLAIGSVYSVAAMSLLGGVMVVGVAAASLFKFFYIPDTTTAKKTHLNWQELKIEGKNKTTTRATTPFAFNAEDGCLIRKLGYDFILTP